MHCKSRKILQKHFFYFYPECPTPFAEFLQIAAQITISDQCTDKWWNIHELFLLFILQKHQPALKLHDLTKVDISQKSIFYSHIEKLLSIEVKPSSFCPCWWKVTCCLKSIPLNFLKMCKGVIWTTGDKAGLKHWAKLKLRSTKFINLAMEACIKLSRLIQLSPMALCSSPSSKISICLSQHQQGILHGSLPDKIATSSAFQLPLVLESSSKICSKSLLFFSYVLS